MPYRIEMNTSNGVLAMGGGLEETLADARKAAKDMRDESYREFEVVTPLHLIKRQDLLDMHPYGIAYANEKGEHGLYNISIRYLTQAEADEIGDEY